MLRLLLPAATESTCGFHFNDTRMQFMNIDLSSRRLVTALRALWPTEAYGTFALVISWGLLVSCEEFFAINDDPNNPTQASVNLLLTNTELAIVNSLGMGTSGLSSILSVYMHQTTRRQSFDAYEVTGEDFAVQQPWSQLYSIALEDLREITINWDRARGVALRRDRSDSGSLRI